MLRMLPVGIAASFFSMSGGTDFFRPQDLATHTLRDSAVHSVVVDMPQVDSLVFASPDKLGGQAKVSEVTGVWGISPRT